MSFSDAAYNLSALEECLELLGLSNGLSTSYENVYVEPPPFSITLPSGKFGSALTSSALLSTAMKFLWSACFWTVSYVIHADVLHLLIFKQLLNESSCGTRISSRGYYLVLWKEPSASSENFPRSIRASDCLHRILSLIFQAWNLPQLRIQHSLLTIWQKVTDIPLKGPSTSWVSTWVEIPSDIHLPIPPSLSDRTVVGKDAHISSVWSGVFLEKCLEHVAIVLFHHLSPQSHAFPTLFPTRYFKFHFQLNIHCHSINSALLTLQTTHRKILYSFVFRNQGA